MVLEPDGVSLSKSKLPKHKRITALLSVDILVGRTESEEVTELHMALSSFSVLE